ncbi:MAG: hypothetical protein H0X37_07305 [Herpetosiphonaceae bacterium]|nr:hypothetical protein [Herpetosiphonaceae bacterium]
MFTSMKLRTLILSIVVLLACGTVGVFAYSNSIKVRNPATDTISAGTITRPEGVTAIPVPRLAPPDSVAFTAKSVGASIKSPDGRAVAQLRTAPRTLSQSVAADFPAGPATSAGEFAFTVLSSIRYTGSGHTVLVTTARPSAAAARETLSLGNKIVQLGDGSTAYALTKMSGSTPNQLAWVKGDLIITIASDLPIDTLKPLADTVIISQ